MTENRTKFKLEIVFSYDTEKAKGYDWSKHDIADGVISHIRDLGYSTIEKLKIEEVAFDSMEETD